MIKILSAEHLKKLDLNPYNTGGYVFNDFGDVFCVEEALWSYDDIYDESAPLFYAIHWEGDNLISENGTTINPVY